ncbi:hypothetical protein BDQ12DRAFT_640483 [Crucibulum laeve]|uniref:Adenylate cyclase n=1 Tax=Crucibulum laeve TaxID=68775 RepID=A0A5C3MF91_9AGAR|nr:hypothetical protein BDQ12DRAFT_640483 [Crucibulum laeve]
MASRMGRRRSTVTGREGEGSQNTSPDQVSSIAPWLDVPATPPTPPPKSPTRTFGFAPKGSFSSLASMKQGSTSKSARPSDSQSTLSVPDSSTVRSADDGDSSRTLFSTSSSVSIASSERKTKSLNVFSKLKKRASKTHMRAESLESEHPSLRPPAPPVPDLPFLGTGPGSTVTLSTISNPVLKKEKRDKKKKASGSTSMASSSSQHSEQQHQFKLDTNLGQMDGIIDMNLASSGVESSYNLSQSDHSHYPQLLSSSDFTNPFSTPTSEKRKARTIASIPDYQKVSPTTVPISSASCYSTSPTAVNGPGGLGSPTWEAPQSWAVLPKGGDDIYEAEVSSSDESIGGAGRSKLNGDDKPSPIPPNAIPMSLTKSISSTNGIAGLIPPEPGGRRGSAVSRRRRPKPTTKPYIIRIYRENNSYHVVSVAFSVSVANLTPALNKKLLLGDDSQIQHRLYLKERGRERLLAQTERPADIVRRRLEQAGYDAADGLELLGGEGLSFLLKFVYKSQLLGPAEEEMKFESFHSVDLSGRSLRTIPVILYLHANSIITLKLSRNPMLEIPLDFIQLCASLREIKMTHMAMKKVPTSIRHASTLHRLDLSSNRISDLDDACLEEIPDLLMLYVQNNKIETLPWSFPRLTSLMKLNLSNNKFKHFPSVVTKLANLADLDVSFNMIAELPDDIGNLTNLRYLTIVGNQISHFPDECSQLVSLEGLDCRRNQISDLSVMCALPKIKHINADHNAVHALDLSLGPNLNRLNTSYNDITQISLRPGPGPVGTSPYALTWLDLSYAKLSSLDDIALGQLSSLKTLRLDHNSFRYIPDTLGGLKFLEVLSCSDNKLDALPSTIGQLQNLSSLDAHNNSLTELPRDLWNCKKLVSINATSNFLGVWHVPSAAPEDELLTENGPSLEDRKMSVISMRGGLPPLASSLKRLFLGENRLTDDVVGPLMLFTELQVLNLSFNEIQDLPSSFFHNMTNLQELYLSGNKLTSIPTEDLHALKKLKTIFLNGNKLQTLPLELGEVKSLTILDVGSNLLKYNINNVEFDWNWNFNKKLTYLNLSGNKRLQIKPEATRHSINRQSRDLSTLLSRQSYAGFTNLTKLRVLGLIDVTIPTTDASVDIPDENDDRRVRTSLSTVNGMAYGIADALGQNDYLTMLDLVEEFPTKENEAIFAMFGRSQPPEKLSPGASPNRLTKFLRDNFSELFRRQLDALNVDKGEGVPDALRRTFLKLNQDLHDVLFANTRKMSQGGATGNVGYVVDSAIVKSGASGIVLYFKGKMLHVGNIGDTLAVISRQGIAQSISTKHDPYDRSETARIRAAEGWVSPPGLVNDQVDVSRSFGYFHLLPIINARPDVSIYELTEFDEFVIVANRGLWDYVPYQTAVDIARTVARTERPDPMIAAQKLRDFAISYGADGSTMIMVIWVADLFGSPARSRQPTLDPIADALIYRTKKREDILDRDISRLVGEVPPPTGHVALVFTDIRNSTHLWEVNPGMPTAMRLHNSLLRRQLRFCGGYEVKTEGDAFMCSFPTALSAVWWCLAVQNKLLTEPWPLEILECEDGKPIHDDITGQILARGLSVRMGIHCGFPVCETDPTTHRMDYFGPMVNRAARINGSAAGGQIMCSTEIIREINATVHNTEAETEHSHSQPPAAIDAIRRMGIAIVPIGEVRLKGLELPEILSAIYPSGLESRQNLKDEPTDTSASGSRIQFSIVQMRELGVLCLRLESLASGRIFRALPERKASIQSLTTENQTSDPASSIILNGDPVLLLPPMNDNSSDSDLMMVLDSLSIRIHNALAALAEHSRPKLISTDTLLDHLTSSGGLNEQTLRHIASLLQKL